MNIDISKIKKIMRKLKHKDPNLFKTLQKKIVQIAQMNYEAILHFKNLRYDLSELKRVQVGSFVLVFSVEHDIVMFRDFDHHKNIYKKRW